MSSLPPVPFERCYWVTSQLLAGPLPMSFGSAIETAARVQALINLGITTVISLLGREELRIEGLADLYEPWLWAPTGGLRMQYEFLVRDGATPSVEKMQSILNALDHALDDGQRVYIHCIGGRGRTGTVVGCWLARHGIATGPAALEHLAALRRQFGLTRESPETGSQRKRVVSWEVGV